LTESLKCDTIQHTQKTLYSGKKEEEMVYRLKQIIEEADLRLRCEFFNNKRHQPEGFVFYPAMLRNILLESERIASVTDEDLGKIITELIQKGVVTVQIRYSSETSFLYNDSKINI